MPTTTRPATVSNTTRDAHLTCAKCEGKGRLNWAAHYANGVCFWCKGTGKVLIQDYNALRNIVGGLMYSVSIVLEAADRGDLERRDFYLASMLPRMMQIGTVEARRVLAAIRSGEYDIDDGMTRVTCNPAAAHATADKLIELGRAARAAEGVAA